MLPAKILCFVSEEAIEIDADACPVPASSRFIDDASVRSPNERLSTDQVYSSVLRDVMAAQYSVSGITMPMIAERCHSLAN